MKAQLTQHLITQYWHLAYNYNSLYYSGTYHCTLMKWHESSGNNPHFNISIIYCIKPYLPLKLLGQLLQSFLSAIRTPASTCYNDNNYDINDDKHFHLIWLCWYFLFFYFLTFLNFFMTQRFVPTVLDACWKSNCLRYMHCIQRSRDNYCDVALNKCMTDTATDNYVRFWL